MAPTFVAAGTFVGSTSTAQPGIPAGTAAGDILLLFVETENEAVSLTTAEGFVQVGTPVGTGVAGAVDASRITVFWKRATGADTAPTVADAGDHVACRILGFRGCKATGDPWNGTPTWTVEAVSDTSLAANGPTTTVDDCLVVIGAANVIDTNTSQTVSYANAGLANVGGTGAGDNTVSGSGGGFNVGTGEKVTAGAVGATTVTYGNATQKSIVVLALAPAAGVLHSRSPADVETLSDSVSAALAKAAALADPLLVDGFEHNSLAVYDATSGTPTIVTTPVRSGSYALEIATVAAAEWVQRNIVAGNRIVATEIDFRFNDLPTADRRIFEFANVNGGGIAYYRLATGQINIFVGTTGNTINIGPTILEDTWYRLSLRFDTSGPTATLYGGVDGPPTSSTGRAQTEADITSMRVGSSNAGTATAYYDDWTVGVGLLSDAEGHAVTAGATTRSVADVETLADLAARILAYRRAPSDVETLADTVSRILARSRPVADVETLADLEAHSIVKTRSLADLLALADSQARAILLRRAPSDVETLADVAARILTYRRAPADVETLADVAARILARVRTAADLETLADLFTYVNSYRRLPADLEILSDSMSYAGAGVQTRSITDLETLVDTMSRLAVYLRPFSDTETLVDLAVPISGHRRSAGDLEVLVDAVSTFSRISRISSDVETLADATLVEGTGIVARAIADVLGLSDTMVAVILETTRRGQGFRIPNLRGVSIRSGQGFRVRGGR